MLRDLLFSVRKVTLEGECKKESWRGKCDLSLWTLCFRILIIQYLFNLQQIIWIGNYSPTPHSEILRKFIKFGGDRLPQAMIYFTLGRAQKKMAHFDCNVFFFHIQKYFTFIFLSFHWHQPIWFWKNQYPGDIRSAEVNCPFLSHSLHLLLISDGSKSWIEQQRCQYKSSYGSDKERPR